MYRGKNNETVRASSTDKERKDPRICPVHKKKYEFLCSTCKQKLCPDCLFEEYTNKTKKHKDHVIDRLPNQIEEARKNLENAIKDAERAYSDANQILENVNKNELDYQENETRIEMYKVFRDIQKELDEKYQEFESQSVQSANSLNLEILEIQKLVEESAAILMSTETSMLKTAKNHILQVKKCIDKPIPNYVPRITPNLDTKIMPPYFQHEYEIQEYSKVYEKNKQAYIYLENFEMFGATWRIKFYPNGNNKGMSTHISIFLEVLNGFEDTYTFDYQVELKNPTNGQPYERHFVSQFTNLDSWGWNRYYPIKSIFEEGYLGSDDTLHLVIRIRPSDCGVWTRITERILEREQEVYKELKSRAIALGKKTPSEKPIPKQHDDVDSSLVQ